MEELSAPTGGHGGGGEWGLLPTICLLFTGSPQYPFGVAGAKNFADVEGAGEKSALFHLENEVYLVKIAFASENLEKFSPQAGYFFVQHL